MNSPSSYLSTKHLSIMLLETAKWSLSGSQPRNALNIWFLVPERITFLGLHFQNNGSPHVNHLYKLIFSVLSLRNTPFSNKTKSKCIQDTFLQEKSLFHILNDPLTIWQENPCLWRKLPHEAILQNVMKTKIFIGQLLSSRHKHLSVAKK